MNLRLDRGDLVLILKPTGVSVFRLVQQAHEALPPFEPGSMEQAEASEMWLTARLVAEADLPLSRRPLRAPHHSVSVSGLVGSAHPIHGEAPRTPGGRRGRFAAQRPVVGHRFLPGEVSLAHGGVLLLDDALEFSGQAIEAVADVLRSGASTIVRGYGTPAERRVVFPAMPYAVVLTTSPEDLERWGRRLGPLAGMVTREVRL